jgi:hypothetical protein
MLLSLENAGTTKKDALLSCESDMSVKNFQGTQDKSEPTAKAKLNSFWRRKDVA